MSRILASWISSACLLLPLAAIAGAADAQGPAKDAASSGSTALEPIVVTGSLIRRTDTETPSPVEVINADDIVKSGLTTIADVLHSFSADNSGTLTSNFSGAMAGGASGVSLRGLTVDATLVLVDGHRMAAYPLADDGQRPFVDIGSLPLGVVDRVEVLKDGASSTYGSDAIAGVVNIITKKEFTGFEASANLGSSYKADGLEQRLSATYGLGNLASDGYNFYVNAEYHHQAEIQQEDRGSYLNQLDLRPYGGNDLRGGIVQQAPPNNGAYTAVGQVAPLGTPPGGTTPAQLDQYFLLPGCAPQNLNYSGGCTWDPNLYKKIQPRAEGDDLTAKLTKRLGDTWTSATTASYYHSESEQWRQPNQYLDGTTTVPFVWAGANGTLVDQTNPATTQIVLPANHPDNPFNPASAYFNAAKAFYGAAFANYIGKPALLNIAFTDIPVQISQYKTDVYRIVEDLTAELGGWDTTLSAGFVQVATHITYTGYVRASALDAALADDQLRIGQNAYLNPPSLYETLAPETHDTATSTLGFVSATASRPLTTLPGGDLGLAVGADARWTRLDNPGEPYAVEGDIVMDGSFYAKGHQDVYAAFAELNAPVLSNLEMDAAARVDHYNEAGTAFTPKFGVKWKVVPQLALRGTFERGFRAPGIAESGNSSAASSTFAPVDPARCGPGLANKPSDCGQGYVAVLSTANPNLKPEHSRQYTLGFILEPRRGINFTADYFNIKRTNEIVGSPLDPSSAVRGAQQAGTTYPGPIIYYATPYINASESVTSGFDGELRNVFPLGAFGTLTAKADATYLVESTQIIDGTEYRYAGTVGPTALSGATGTPRTRGSFTLEWSLEPVTIGATLNYRSHMNGVDPSNGPACLQLTDPNPHCFVASFTYLDMYGQYQFSPKLRVTATVSNVTNRLPPLDTATYGGTNYNPSLDQPGAVGTFFELGVNYKY
ncbi:MAG TPA: TonB-dependent receptor [Steroidobacteraceae bacterium]|nr:TonB-dependent receptor [Steroidobacteraceae bacterium]